MDSKSKRYMFLLAVFVLVMALVVISAVTLAQGPRDTGVKLISKNGTTDLLVDDLYEGEMTIPYFNMRASTYKPDDFLANKGIITYEGGDSFVGINVNSQHGEIDWTKVAENRVDFAMIRVGYRGRNDGKIYLDANFETNIQHAQAAGIPVGVYFFSKAVTDSEAEEEATFVLEQIQTYSIEYPVAFCWRYGLNDDGTRNKDDRTVRCNGDQVTGFIDTFCQKIKAVGRTPSYFCDKSMGYGTLNLDRLKGYDMWYSEYRAAPSFYYDFQMWQYTEEGSVPGIESAVPISLALKKYR